MTGVTEAAEEAAGHLSSRALSVATDLTIAGEPTPLTQANLPSMIRVCFVLGLF